MISNLPDLAREADEVDCHQVWKKNSRFYYDTLITHQLEWPSLTCHFQPQPTSDSGLYRNHMACISVKNDEQGTNWIILADITVPVKGRRADSQPFGLSRKSDELIKLGFTAIQTERRALHSGEVNKARFSPTNPALLATTSSDCSVYIHSVQDDSITQVAKLAHHQTEGFGLDWSSDGKVATGDNGGTVVVWDPNSSQAVRIWTENESGLQISMPGESSPATNDVRFHPGNGNLVLSAVDDGTVRLRDQRASGAHSVLAFEAHQDGVYSVAPSSTLPEAVLTGGGDSKCKIWDLRKTAAPHSTYAGHKGKVIRVEWAPRENSLFATSGEDGQVLLWTAFNAKSGHPNAPIFAHLGHSGQVDDIAWNPGRAAELISTDSDNSLQLWEPDLRAILR